MKYFFTICIVGLLSTFSVFSQGRHITHTVEKGETINQIAQKYSVTPYDIYQLNPDAQSGLKPNSVLLIPKKSTKEITNVQAEKTSNERTHEVVAKETLYGIEKMYGVSDEDLKKANPNIELYGLQIGQILTIPSKNSIKKATQVQDKLIYHDVLPKETKYSIAKQYGITIEELEKRNPEIVANLPIGFKLLIKGNAPKVVKVAEVAEVTEAKKEILKSNPIIAPTVIEYLSYEVKPKETLYSLSKMFEMTQEELISLNPELKNGVEIGMLLKVPSKTSILNDSKKEYSSLSKIISDGKRKKMALLLPFNISNIESDTVNSTSTRLKKDKFLNMTLDFYSGVLMAIDSAKVLGLPIDVSIFDSQETKNNSNIAAIVQKNKLHTYNAIVGPFYQSNAETIAVMLKEYNVPVISPLSKDVGNPYSNLYQTIPTNEAVKNTMFEYMRANNGNIIAVVDKKKESIIQYIKEYQKGVPFVAFNSNGSVSADNLKSLLVKDKMNYVVMETGNTWMIKTTIASMLSSMTDYRVQLVILETNETLNTDEINFLNLTKLKLMYPSVTRENESPEAVIFDKEYKKNNNVFPSAFATRGFDVTFDTMMRLVQNTKFEETVNSVATKQIDSKFEYYKKEDGGYTNKGVFILYYDTDLIIKEAK
ncbi:LysM peptidoglycan-binding domain-containing protein [Flavobacterium sp. K5-23]|uniref:LysM peptidoglycan-binding domain-containing protein n=1 Tax=Flavobacterium sp. K5-23 TaxID=2746225 RepID=UPI00200FBDBC|nr:LysM peptidoglycan-binding domain-containing protein [Flavobacterium sp. K5-23]UQD56389.1 LysM peptidoglycan-binding domain-containing protein [Flavobacterium sp. K5-23]